MLIYKNIAYIIASSIQFFLWVYFYYLLLLLIFLILFTCVSHIADLWVCLVGPFLWKFCELDAESVCIQKGFAIDSVKCHKALSSQYYFLYNLLHLAFPCFEFWVLKRIFLFIPRKAWTKVDEFPAIVLFW